MAAKKKERKPFSIGMRDGFVEAPSYRPGINIGGCFDIPTGRYEKNNDGHYYHTGGLNHVTGIGGRGNSYKSTLSHWMLLTALGRFMPYADAQSRDTEFSQSYQRFQDLSINIPQLDGLDMETCPNFSLTSQGETSGNEWFKNMSDRLNEKKHAGKDFIFTTPFTDKRTEKPFKVFYPSFIEIDSLSAFTTTVVDDTFEKNEVGASGANMVFARAAGAKSQMIMQLPSIVNQSGSYALFTAHMGDAIDLDPYNPSPKKLTFLKNKVKFKNVPENITFLTNNLWIVTGLKTEITKDRTPTYPKYENEAKLEDNDLQCVTVLNTRGKSGPSGLPFDVIISQREGVLPSITEFAFIKKHGRYGLDGNNVDFNLDLYPDKALNRRNLRQAISEDAKLARALTITSELCQIKFLAPTYRRYLMSPKKLLKELLAKGYDIDKILTSRGYWVFRECEKDLPPFLSTLDILIMASGLEEHSWHKDFKK